VPIEWPPTSRPRIYGAVLRTPRRRILHILIKPIDPLRKNVEQCLATGSVVN